MPTINDLRQQAATIKNATQVGENTATRVGTTFETIADLLEQQGVGQGVPSVDLSQLNTLRTPADQTTANPTIYNVTTLHNLSSTTIKVGTLFIFSDGGRAVVTQILLSNYQVDGGGNISSPNASQITMYYRMYNIVNEAWSAWTLYGGGGGGGTIDPYPVSGSSNAVESNGVFEGLQKAAPEVDINYIDDLDDFVDMQTGVASTYTIKAYHNLSSTWLRVGVLMVFANQAQNTLTQICISNCMVDGGGNLIPNYTTNVMNVFYRFKQFNGVPPEGMTIGVWTTWAKFGDSGYQPDNEDINLNASDQLQFANKAYDASAFSGLGRVYLHKNIVELNLTDKYFDGFVSNVLVQDVGTSSTPDEICFDTARKMFVARVGLLWYTDWSADEDYNPITSDVNWNYNGNFYRWNGKELAQWDKTINQLTQAMMNTANTIYHIQYDYDINGQNITLPAGCVLEFAGGSVCDLIGTGKIVFNGTKIGGDAKILCDYEGTIDGMVQGQWFGLVPNDNTFDNSPIIEKVCTTFNQVTISGGKYYCSTPMVLAMSSEKTLIVYSDLEYTQQDTSNAFITISGNRLYVRFFGTIYGPMANIPSGNTTELSIGIKFEDFNDGDVYIKQVTQFHTDVQVFGKDAGNGTSYNSFVFDLLIGAKVLLHLKAENTGWVTTNTFKCNRLTSFSGLTQPDTAILVEADQATFTDVVFTKISMEGFSGSEPIKIYKASRMKFENIRSEANYQYLAYVEEATDMHFQTNYGTSFIRVAPKQRISVFDDNTRLVPYAPLENAIRRPDGNKEQILFNACDTNKSQSANYGAITYNPVGFIIPLTYRPMLITCKDKFTPVVVYFDSTLTQIDRSDSIMPSGTVQFKNASRVGKGMETNSNVSEIAICLPSLTGVSYVGFFFFMNNSNKGLETRNPVFMIPQFAADSIVTSFYTYDQYFEYQHYGTTAQRPVITQNWRNFMVGFEYFDTTLGKPIYAKSFDSNGNGTWVDATGAVV